MSSSENSGQHGLEDRDWNQLLEQIQHKKCTPIVGSGAVTGGAPVGATNWKFEYPVGAALAQEWAKDCEYPLEDETRIERVAQFIGVESGPVVPKERIKRRFATATLPDFSLDNEPHRVLAELNLPIYLTTNFDDYLIRALRTAEKDVRVSLCRWNKHIPRDAPAYDPDPAQRDLIPYALAGEGEEPGALGYEPATEVRYKPSPASPLVYHFHGNIAWPSSMVVTEDDYFEFLLNVAKAVPSLIMPRIEQVFGDGSLLFLGYKLTDWDFLVLFRYLADRLKTGGFKHIAVQLGPMTGAHAADTKRAANAARYLNTYFGTRNIKVYWGTCQEFVAELRRRRG